MIKNAEVQFANVIDFPAVKRDDDHAGGLIIDHYDQWTNPTAGPPRYCFTYKEDEPEAAA